MADHKITGHILNTRNDGTFVLRIYKKDHPALAVDYIDYELAVDDLIVDVHMDFAYLCNENGIYKIRDGQLDYKIGDEVWYIPRGSNILIKCKITEVDDQWRKKEPQAYLFYDIEEPCGHFLADDEFFVADSTEEALEVFQEYLREWYGEEDKEERRRVDTLEEFRKRVIHFVIATHNEIDDEDKIKVEKEWYDGLPAKTQGVDWFNATDILNDDKLKSLLREAHDLKIVQEAIAKAEEAMADYSEPAP